MLQSALICAICLIAAALSTPSLAEGPRSLTHLDPSLPPQPPTPSPVALKKLSEQEAKMLLQKVVKLASGNEELLKNSRRALNEIVLGLEITGKTASERIQALSQLVEGSDFNAAQKEILRALIATRELGSSRLYQIADARNLPQAKNLDEKLLANSFLSWVSLRQAQYLEERDGQIISLLNKSGKWRQVSKPYAANLIEAIRNAKRTTDRTSETKAVTNYLMILTPEERTVFLADVFASLKNVATSRMDKDVLTSLAWGARNYYLWSNNKTAHEGNEEGKQYAAAYKTNFAERAGQAHKLFDLTHAYVTKIDDKYVFDPSKKSEFESTIKSFNQDQLITFAAGLGATEAHRDYGDRLMLALSLNDGKGQRILPTQKALLEDDPTGQGVDSPNGGLLLSEASHASSIPVNYVRQAVQAWDGDGSTTPRSHRHVLQSVGDIQQLLPAKSEPPRQIWVNEEGKLKSYQLSPEGSLAATDPSATKHVGLKFEPQDPKLNKTPEPPPAIKSVNEKLSEAEVQKEYDWLVENATRVLGNPALELDPLRKSLESETDPNQGRRRAIRDPQTKQVSGWIKLHRAVTKPGEPSHEIIEFQSVGGSELVINQSSDRINLNGQGVSKHSVFEYRIGSTEFAQKHLRQTTTYTVSNNPKGTEIRVESKRESLEPEHSIVTQRKVYRDPKHSEADESVSETVERDAKNENGPMTHRISETTSIDDSKRLHRLEISEFEKDGKAGTPGTLKSRKVEETVDDRKAGIRTITLTPYDVKTGAAGAATVKKFHLDARGVQGEPINDSSPLRVEESRTAMQDTADSIADTGFDLFSGIYTAEGNRGKNVAIAPASLSSVLGMAFTGTVGPTHNQIANAMHLKASTPNGLSPDFWPPFSHGFQTLSKELSRKENGVEYATANAAYVGSGFKVDEGYVRRLAGTFGAEAKSVDFTNAKDVAGINNFILQGTRKKIGPIIKVGEIPNDGAALLNAVYFKGDWTDKFKVKDTVPANFQIPNSTPKPVQLMWRRDARVPYFKGNGFKMVSLPFGSERGATGYTMDIIVPDENKTTSIRELSQKLNAENYKTWVGSLKETSGTSVALPRFRVDFEASSLTDLMKKKMPNAFLAGPDFAAMTTNTGVKLEKIVHKVVLNINEDGGEGAAVSGGIVAMGAPPQGPEVKADHPFVYVIRDRTTNMPVFIGTLENPVQGDPPKSK